MNPALILPIITSIITSMPTIIEGVEKAKTFVSALFTSGLLTAEQQNALHQHVDALGVLALAGITPSHWLVQPDPA